MSIERKSVRIAVTGSSGFVGSWLKRCLCEAPWGPHVEVAPLLALRSPGAPDICDADFVAEEVRRVNPTAVVHLAAVAAPVRAASDPQTAWQVNVLGTLNLAQAIMRHAPSARLVYAGSSEVYGARFNTSSIPLDENVPLEPISVYGATKAAADLMLGQMANDGLQIIRFRPFNHTGPGQSPNYVVSNFAQQIASIEAGRQEPFIKVGNLLARRDFLDVRDVVRAYAGAAVCDLRGQAGIAVNLATGHPMSIKSMLDLLLGMAKVPINVQLDEKRLRPSDIECASGNPKRAAEFLDWQPVIPFEKTLADVLDHWRLMFANARPASNALP